MSVEINAILSSWSIFIQILIEIPLFLLFLIAAFTTKKRVILIWTIAWLFNLLALSSVYYVARAILIPKYSYLGEITYSTYAVFKITFAILLLFSVYQYITKERYIKFPFKYYIAFIILLFALFLSTKAVEIQFWVYLIVSLSIIWSGILLLKKKKSSGGRIIAAGFLINGAMFFHHAIILVQWFYIHKTPAYMSRISFFDSVSEFILALSFILAITVDAVEELQDSNKKLMEKQEILRELVDFDPLTGLRNRRILREFIDNVKGSRGVVVFIDIDNFKKINDSFGHTVGDKCIVEIAKEIKNDFRTEDGLFRYGGDEFLLILPNMAEGEVGIRLNKLKDRIRNAVKGVNLSFSFGISEFDNENLNFTEVLNKADKKMYEAKKNEKQK